VTSKAITGKTASEIVPVALVPAEYLNIWAIVARWPGRHIDLDQQPATSPSAELIPGG